jgi:CheY-like chemotaxis protein
MSETSGYDVECATCRARFQALDAPWCSCLVTERTLVCPHCHNCFCKAPNAYKQRFWSGAPKALWDRKFDAHHQAAEPRPNPAPDAVRRPLVLLVDDEPDIQRLAALAIDSLGYGLVMGRNGEEGLELASRYHPDLVLSDALMPRMDGREMCRRIKQDPATAGVKVVVMTGLYTSVKYRTEAFKTFQVDDYLSKPVDLDTLRALLKKHLG